MNIWHKLAEFVNSVSGVCSLGRVEDESFVIVKATNVADLLPTQYLVSLGHKAMRCPLHREHNHRILASVHDDLPRNHPRLASVLSQIFIRIRQLIDYFDRVPENSSGFLFLNYIN
jgi:hypothetical protein